MATCPNCGIENSESRVFCAVCGTRLRPDDAPAEPPAPPAFTGTLLPDWLKNTGENHGVPAEPPKKAGLPSWLSGASVPAEPTRPSPRVDRLPGAPTGDPSVEPPPAAARRSQRPAPEPPVPGAEDAEAWDEQLDFSDLPDWEIAKAETTVSAPAAEGSKEPPLGGAEPSGLLAGVTGAIPIEPIIRDPRRASVPPAVTDELLPEGTDENAALFARIAAGATGPEPLARRRARTRGEGLFHLLLLLTVVSGLALRANGWELFAAPAAGAATQAYASTLAALPANAEILLALDVDGTVLDEMSPPLAATFDQLGRVAPEGRVLVASSSPVGAALIERSTPEEARIAIETESPGYITGGPAGQRAVLERSSADLMLVVAGESSGAQRWIEQGSVAAPDRPILVITPARSEMLMRPYLASGQVDGALLTLAESAAYERALGRAGGAVRRIEAVTLAAGVMLLAMGAGFLRGRS